MWTLALQEGQGLARLKKTCFLPRHVREGTGRCLRGRSTRLEALTYQQLRLKTLSCREKLSFMAGVLRSKGGKADCAHRLIVPVPRCPDPGTRAGWGWGATSALLGQKVDLPPGKEVGCKSRAGCARPPAVLEGISGGPFQILRSFRGFSAPRPTGSSRVPGSASTSNRLEVDGRPRPRTHSGPAPCGRSGRSPAVALATRTICVPGSLLSLPWPPGSRAGPRRSPQQATCDCRPSRR